MDDPQHLTLVQRFFQWGNNWILTSLISLERPGSIFRWLFRIPIKFFQWNLTGLVPGWMLLLTTTGRKSGKLRYSVLEFSRRESDGAYIIMSGFSAHSDWLKNLQACPDACVQVGKEKVNVTASPVGEGESMAYLGELIRLNPGARLIFARYVGHPIDGSDESLREVSQVIPVIALVPEGPNGRT
jgi:deazaflavin-dependent oxidoreductase (nitroreductase family)